MGGALGAVSLAIACGSESPGNGGVGPGGSRAGGAGGATSSGAAGAAGSNQAGAPGSGQAGAAGISQAGAAGSSQAGAAGFSQAGAAGISQAGAAGSSQAGAGGSSPAGAAGISQAGAAGSNPMGAAGMGQAGAGGSDGGGAAGAGPAGAGGTAGNAGSAGAGGSVVGKFGCTVPSLIADPLVAPEGFTGHEIKWEDLFYGATFPEGKSHLSPVGAFTLRKLQPSTKGPSMNARFLYTPFVAEPDKAYSISWVGAQPIAIVQYGMARGAKAVFVSISRCAGDLRPRKIGSADQDLTLCRGLASNGKFGFGAKPGNYCKLEAGQTYYLNIAFVQPGDGLTLDETTCEDGLNGRCEANFDAL